MPALEDRAVEVSEEAIQTIRWRRDQLLAAGYEYADAKLIARRTDVDLHLAVRIMRSGCPSAEARRILL